MKKALIIAVMGMSFFMPSLATAQSVNISCNNIRFELSDVNTSSKDMPINACGRQLWMSQHTQFHADSCFRQGGAPIYDGNGVRANRVCTR